MPDEKCPLCRRTVKGHGPACPRCDRIYHRECWDYLATCGLVGCGDSFEPLPADGEHLRSLEERMAFASRCAWWVIALRTLASVAVMVSLCLAAVLSFRGGLGTRSGLAMLVSLGAGGALLAGSVAGRLLLGAYRALRLHRVYRPSMFRIRMPDRVRRHIPLSRTERLLTRLGEVLGPATAVLTVAASIARTRPPCPPTVVSPLLVSMAFVCLPWLLVLLAKRQFRRLRAIGNCVEASFENARMAATTVLRRSDARASAEDA